MSKNENEKLGQFLQSTLQIPALEMGHKHSGHEAVMSGGANACPICQAFKIQGLEAQLRTIQFEDGQHARTLHDIIQQLKAWGDDAQQAYNIATNQVWRDACANRLIEFKGAEKLLKEMLKEILKRTADAHTKAKGGITAEDRSGEAVLPSQPESPTMGEATGG